MAGGPAHDAAREPTNTARITTPGMTQATSPGMTTGTVTIIAADTGTPAVSTARTVAPARSDLAACSALRAARVMDTGTAVPASVIPADHGAHGVGAEAAVPGAEATYARPFWSCSTSNPGTATN